MRAQALGGTTRPRKLGDRCWFKTVLNGKKEKSASSSSKRRRPRLRESLQVLAPCMFTGGKGRA